MVHNAKVRSTQSTTKTTLKRMAWYFLQLPVLNNLFSWPNAMDKKSNKIPGQGYTLRA